MLHDGMSRAITKIFLKVLEAFWYIYYIYNPLNSSTFFYLHQDPGDDNDIFNMTPFKIVLLYNLKSEMKEVLKQQTK